MSEKPKSERGDKIRKAREEAAARYAQQVIPIDDNWKVSRFDEKNWIVEYKGDFYGYFGTLPAAFKSLPAKMLSAEAKSSLNQICGILRTIGERIDEAIKLAKFCQ